MSKVIKIINNSDEVFDRIRVYYDNGYSASVIIEDKDFAGMRFGGSIQEIAILNNAGELVYDTPITDDVIKYSDGEHVLEILNDISELEKR